MIIKPALYVFDEDQTHDLVWGKISNALSRKLGSYLPFDNPFRGITDFTTGMPITLIERFSINNSASWADNWATQFYEFIKYVSRYSEIGLNGFVNGFNYVGTQSLSASNRQGNPDGASRRTLTYVRIKVGAYASVTYLEYAYGASRVFSKYSNRTITESCWIRRERVFTDIKEDFVISVNTENALFNSMVLVNAESVVPGGNGGFSPDSEALKRGLLYEHLSATLESFKTQVLDYPLKYLKSWKVDVNSEHRYLSFFNSKAYSNNKTYSDLYSLVFSDVPEWYYYASFIGANNNKYESNDSILQDMGKEITVRENPDFNTPGDAFYRIDLTIWQTSEDMKTYNLSGADLRIDPSSFISISDPYTNFGHSIADTKDNTRKTLFTSFSRVVIVATGQVVLGNFFEAYDSNFIANDSIFQILGKPRRLRWFTYITDDPYFLAYRPEYETMLSFDNRSQGPTNRTFNSAMDMQLAFDCIHSPTFIYLFDTPALERNLFQSCDIPLIWDSVILSSGPINGEVNFAGSTNNSQIAYDSKFASQEHTFTFSWNNLSLGAVTSSKAVITATENLPTNSLSFQTYYDNFNNPIYRRNIPLVTLPVKPPYTLTANRTLWGGSQSSVQNATQAELDLWIKNVDDFWYERYKLTEDIVYISSDSYTELTGETGKTYIFYTPGKVTLNEINKEIKVISRGVAVTVVTSVGNNGSDTLTINDTYNKPPLEIFVGGETTVTITTTSISFLCVRNYYEDFYYENNISEIYTDVSFIMPDSIRIKEIHAALKADKFAVNDDNGQARVANLGYYVERIARVLGISVNSDGSIRSVRQRATIIPSASGNATIPAGWGRGQWQANTGGMSAGQEGGLNTENRDGIVYANRCNRNVASQFNEASFNLEPPSYVLCENIMQVIESYLEDLDQGLNWQEMGAMALPAAFDNDDGTRKYCTYEGMGTLLAEVAYMLSSVSQDTSQTFMSSIVTQAIAKTVLEAVGTPVRIMGVDVDIDDGEQGKSARVPVPMLEADAPTLVSLLFSIIENQSRIIGSNMKLKKDKPLPPE